MADASSGDESSATLSDDSSSESDPEPETNAENPLPGPSAPTRTRKRVRKVDSWKKTAFQPARKRQCNAGCEYVSISKKLVSKFIAKPIL